MVLELSRKLLMIYQVPASPMSENQNEKRNLEKAQHDQDNPGAAESNPNTAGPAENLRGQAAKAENKTEGSKEPA